MKMEKKNCNWEKNGMRVIHPKPPPLSFILIIIRVVICVNKSCSYRVML